MGNLILYVNKVVSFIRSDDLEEGKFRMGFFKRRSDVRLENR